MDSLRINFDNNAGFGKLDPATSRSTATNNILLNIFQGLYRFVGRELVPAVAESVDVKEHHQEFIFHLRETCWSDGKPVVAQDFYYAWLRVIQNPDAPARRFFSYIQKWTHTGPTVFHLQLSDLRQSTTVLCV